MKRFAKQLLALALACLALTTWSIPTARAESSLPDSSDASKFWYSYHSFPDDSATKFDAHHEQRWNTTVTPWVDIVDGHYKVTLEAAYTYNWGRGLWEGVVQGKAWEVVLYDTQENQLFTIVIPKTITFKRHSHGYNRVYLEKELIPYPTDRFSFEGISFTANNGRATLGFQTITDVFDPDFPISWNRYDDLQAGSRTKRGVEFLYDYFIRYAGSNSLGYAVDRVIEAYSELSVPIPSIQLDNLDTFLNTQVPFDLRRHDYFLNGRTSHARQTLIDYMVQTVRPALANIEITAPYDATVQEEATAGRLRELVADAIACIDVMGAHPDL